MRTQMTPRTVMFETSSMIDTARSSLKNVAEFRDLLQLLKNLTTSGKIQVVYTHIQVDEITNNDEAEIARDFLAELNAREISTGVGVWDISEWDKSDWRSELDNLLYEKLRAPESKKGWLKDLIQAFTQVDILVTDDSGVQHAINEIRKLRGELRGETYRLEDFLKLSKTL